jgi:mannosyl-oligosaccharide alpha-1,2-mannosidase
LADTLKFAFDTPSGVPWKTLWIEKQESNGNTANSAVAVGSLILEWTRLAQLTGKSEYRIMVEEAMKPLLHPQPSWTESFPGIVGNWVDVLSGEFTDDWGSWGPGGDSFYEYLIKMFAYDQTNYGFNKERWVTAADSVMEYMVETPPGTNLNIITRTNGQELRHVSSHLECFAGGNFILGGKILNDTRYVNFGLKVTESCHEMYIRTATRIGPESITWSTTEMTEKQWAQYEVLGFAIEDSRYQLRPETMESYYYAYRATGDRKYQDWAWDAFVAIVAHTKMRNGFAPLSNVNKVGGGWKIGKQESFFFSELLKYTYLIFADVGHLLFWLKTLSLIMHRKRNTSLSLRDITSGFSTLKAIH